MFDDYFEKEEKEEINYNYPKNKSASFNLLKHQRCSDSAHKQTAIFVNKSTRLVNKPYKEYDDIMTQPRTMEC